MNKKAIFKWNDGQLALICSNCRTVIKEGKDFNEMELAAYEGTITLLAQYCKQCEFEDEMDKLSNTFM